MVFNEESLRHRELDDFLGVREVKGWKQTSLSDTFVLFGAAIVVAILFGALLYVIK